MRVLAVVGGAGTTLFVLGVLGVPLTRVTFIVVGLAAAALALIKLRVKRPDWGPFILLSLPVLLVPFVLSVTPPTDYDGRLTWLPKAEAISAEASIRGPFFQGERGLNLHNRYPLLVPLNVAMLEAFGLNGRHLFWLVPYAALAWCLAHLRGRKTAWLVALIPWLPAVVAAPEGGAMSAYVDLTVMAFTGAAILSITPRNSEEPEEPRNLPGVWLAFLILTKNEGILIAAAILFAILVFRGVKNAAWLVAPPTAAALLLAWWRQSIPAAYDEQYEVLIRELPAKIGRIGEAFLGLARHAVDIRHWGLFWIVAAVCCVIGIARKQEASLVCILVVCGYVITFTVTSWNIAELANVSANRLLSHLLIPATLSIAAALEHKS